jgi:hypothetical protein
MAKSSRGTKSPASRTRAASSKEPVASVISPEEPAVTNGRHQPTQDEIATRAYHLYLARGGTNGQALDDWLQAEREMQAT